MKTYIPGEDQIERKWWIVDAEDKVLGRLAAEIAVVIRGKNKTIFTPHLDCGDFVIVVNADKVKLTGQKERKKIYQKYSGYMGGLREETAAEVRERNPRRLVEQAVWGMLPKGRLGRAQFGKLKVYTGSEHPHQAQKPEALHISSADK